MKSIKKAAAVRYTLSDRAPRIIAKGEGRIAEKIIKSALEYNVPIVHDPKLVELLSYVDIDKIIPESLYLIVAEVLAYIYTLDKEYSVNERKP